MQPKGFGICKNGSSNKDRRFVIPYYLKRVLNKFCNKESKELRMSCAVNISKLHRILIDFKLSDKSLIDSLASSKIPFASLGGFIPSCFID